MSIDPIQKNLITHISNLAEGHQTLKDNQILSAKILRLFPDQKSEIEIGNNRFIAQLEASLVVGKRYYFQVYVQKNIIFLKLLNEQKSKNSDINVKELLNTIGLKDGKTETLFVQKLLKQNILFQKTQLIQVLRLLNNVPNQSKSEQILLNMIKQQTPITKDIYEALCMRGNISLQESLNSLHSVLDQISTEPISFRKGIEKQQLSLNKNPKIYTHAIVEVIKNILKKTGLKNESNIEELTLRSSQTSVSKEITLNNQRILLQKDRKLFVQASELIGRMTNENTFKKSIWMKKLIPEIIQNKNLFEELKSSEVLHKEVSFNNWKESWEQFINKTISTKYMSPELPFHLAKEELLLSLNKQPKSNQVLKVNVKNLLRYFSKDLLKAIQNQTTLSEGVFLEFKQKIMQKVLPNLNPIKQEELNQTLKNHLEGLRQTITLLASLLEEATIIKSNELMTVAKLDQLLNIPKAQNLFMENIKQATTNLGLNYEKLLVNYSVEKDPPIALKSILMQLADGTNHQLADQSRRMIQLINGLQLNSIQESNHMLQASLQLPGAPLGLTNDMKIDLEGSKTTDGMIDADFCRIMFYLDLASIEKTIIDMKIQNRAIQITVFNDHPKIKQTADQLQVFLAEGLDSLSYTLSNVIIKSINEQSAVSKNEIAIYKKQKGHQGVDYLI